MTRRPLVVVNDCITTASFSAIGQVGSAGGVLPDAEQRPNGCYAPSVSRTSATKSVAGAPARSARQASMTARPTGTKYSSR